MAVRSHPGAPRQSERGHDLPDHRLAPDDAAVGEQGETASRIEAVHPPARAVLVGHPLGNSVALLQARPELRMADGKCPEARQVWDFGPRQAVDDWLPVNHKEESDPGHLCLLQIGSGFFPQNNPFGYQFWRSIATGSLLRPPSSPRMEAITKRVSLVRSVPFPAWVCPETGTLGTTSCGVKGYGSSLPPLTFVTVVLPVFMSMDLMDCEVTWPLSVRQVPVMIFLPSFVTRVSCSSFIFTPPVDWFVGVESPVAVAVPGARFSVLTRWLAGHSPASGGAAA
jgi:hypothetical protein